MIQETACIYLSENKINELIGDLDHKQDSELYKMLRSARLNIFRY